MLIRHAEKALQDEAAVNLRGHPDPRSLSVRGWMRAGALVSLFGPAQRPPGVAAGRTDRPASEHLQRPMHLLAARAATEDVSTRPRDTLQPLAQSLGLPIDERFGADDTPADIAAHLRRLEGPVLVSWRRSTLPALANELLQRVAAPTRWPEPSFDMVWVIEQSRLSWELVQVPQRLLDGDATHVRRRVMGRR